MGRPPALKKKKTEEEKRGRSSQQKNANFPGKKNGGPETGRQGRIHEEEA